MQDAALRRADLEARIIELIAAEIQDKSAVLTRDTRRDEVEIDSIDIVNVMFAVEDRFGAAVDLSPANRFDTVGDLVDMLISFIPEDRR